VIVGLAITEAGGVSIALGAVVVIGVELEHPTRKAMYKYKMASVFFISGLLYINRQPIVTFCERILHSLLTFIFNPVIMSGCETSTRGKLMMMRKIAVSHKMLH